MPFSAHEGTGTTSVATSAATVKAEPASAVAVRRFGTDVRVERRHGSEIMNHTIPKNHMFHIVHFYPTGDIFHPMKPSARKSLLKRSCDFHHTR